MFCTMQVSNNMGVSKLWQNCHFVVNYPFNKHFNCWQELKYFSSMTSKFTSIFCIIFYIYFIFLSVKFESYRFQSLIHFSDAILYS